MEYTLNNKNACLMMYIKWRTQSKGKCSLKQALYMVFLEQNRDDKLNSD